MINIGSLFTRHAIYRPDHPAIVFEDKRLTCLELNRSINRLANALLKLGIGKGDKVATVLPNCLELYETYWAVAKIGAVVVPMSTLLTERGLRNLLNNSDALVVISNSSFIDVLSRLRPELTKIKEEGFILTDAESETGYPNYHQLKAEVGDEEPSCPEFGGSDPFNLIYSSGTTGEPKGIVISHDARAAYCTSFASAYRMTPESVTMHAGAIVFNGSFVDMMPTVFLGATYVLLPQFDAEDFIETVRREKVTHIMLVPSQIIAILNAPNFSPEALQSLEMILSLGAPLHMEHKKILNEELPNRFYELYGLTEGFVTVQDITHYKTKPESVGVPLPFSEMKIVDADFNEVPVGEVGEICGRGPHLMNEYYNRPDLTEKTFIDGWLLTGDLGYVDEDGFLYLADRKKDLIISGGINVYPRDIEEIISQHPEVKETAVFGIPDDKWGETPVAVVILKNPGSVSGDGLKEWTNSRVEAKFQRLSRVDVMDDFPRSLAGKTLKRELRDLFQVKKSGD